MSIKLDRYSVDAYRIVDEKGAVVYMALRLANNEWGAYDSEEKRVSKRTFNSPSAVLAFFETME